jgi:CheY-like chemotaxis protein
VQGGGFITRLVEQHGCGRLINSYEERPIMTYNSGKLVLCIDDEAALLRMLKTTLDVFGYAALVSTDSSEAVEIVRQNSVDAVVLDYAMPGRNGVDIALELKSLRPEIPIIMFSASRVPVSALMAIDGFVSKREGASVLVSVLERVLESAPDKRPVIRKSPRYPVALPFMVKVERDGAGCELHGLCTDIGEGGLGGELYGELSPGELVEVQILNSELGAFQPRAQVRYRQNNLCGLQFLDLDPAQQDALSRSCESLAYA